MIAEIVDEILSVFYADWMLNNPFISFLIDMFEFGFCSFIFVVFVWYPILALFRWIRGLLK